MSLLDRRSAGRYSIRARLRWESIGHRGIGEGSTRNISMLGVYFQGDQPLAVGESIRLTIALQRRSICLGGDGVVVRVEPREAGYGTGVWLKELAPLPDAYCGNRTEPSLLERGGGWLQDLLKLASRSGL